MSLKLLFTTILCCILTSGFAQRSGIDYCAAAKRQPRPMTANKGTVADTSENWYDVKYVKLDLSMNNRNTSISGNALTQAVATATMGQYVFELTADLTIDSVKVNNQTCTFTRTGDVCKVTLANPIPVNTAFAARVYYHGAPVGGSSSFLGRGIQSSFIPASTDNFATFTIGEPYNAKDWWPCKQALQDKIDSSDVWLTVPDTTKAGSNGLLQNVTVLGPNKNRYEWKSRMPIDYYLISAAVGPYTDYSYFVHFSNSTDSMLIRNYITPYTLSTKKAMLDTTAAMLSYFSTLFGRYPFWKEKYGHCEANFTGEEHQTMTTMGYWLDNIIAHELCHQWFGDHVTCATWKDTWLNEGFASYGEYLYWEHFLGPTAARDDIRAKHNYALSAGAVIVADTTSVQQIFGSATYYKGASAIHTLRFEANNDSLFFHTLQQYQQQFANSTATTQQFKNLVAQQYGRNMDTFFNEWIYASGYPVFNATWNQKNDIVIVHLDQTAVGDYTAHKYSTPIEIKFSSATGDTILRFQTNDNATDFSFAWPKSVVSLTIDPNEWLLKGTGTITRDNNLGVGSTIISAGNIYPNPVHDFLTITNADRIQLTDITGKLLIDQAGSNKVDVRGLVPGTYLYRTFRSGKAVNEGKMLKL